MDSQSIGKILFLLGTVFIIIGLFFYFPALQKFIFLGKLPGDINIKGENSSFHFPITTCLLISAILSLIGYFLRK